MADLSWQGIQAQLIPSAPYDTGECGVNRVLEKSLHQAANGHWVGSRLHAVQRSLCSPRGSLAQISSGTSMLNDDISFSTPPWHFGQLIGSPALKTNLSKVLPHSVHLYS
jgi:hypothetical protein